MDQQLLSFSRRSRRLLLLLAVAGGATVIICNTPAVIRLRRRLSRLCSATAAFADAAAAVLEAAAAVSTDVSAYLSSDLDPVPNSVKQLCKLATSAEATAAASRLSESLSAGVLRGYYSCVESTAPSSGAGASGFSERLLDKLFSPAGAGFVSHVANNVAHSAVTAYFDNTSTAAASSEPSLSWVAVIAGDPCREAIRQWVTVFVGTAVEVFIDKTIHINAYDQIFAGLTNPDHESRVREMLVSVCNNAVETLVRSSHSVLTRENNRGILRGNEQNEERGESSAAQTNIHSNGRGGMRWVETVSSTLSVPDNRSFVLDVTGRITFETVRSFLEFILRKMYDGARKGAETLNEEVVGRGFRAVRYLYRRPLLITVVCITLCLHVWIITRVRSKQLIES